MSTPFFLKPPASEGNQDDRHDHHLLFTPECHALSSSCPIQLNIAVQDHQNTSLLEHHQQQHKLDDQANMQFWSGGDQHLAPTSAQSVDHHKKYHNNVSDRPSLVCKRGDGCDDPSGNSSQAKWMSSKMRLMRKMMNPDRTVGNEEVIDTQTCPTFSRLRPRKNEESNNSSNGVIRVCADCSTTKTPLWRSGPRGPKSLCNACGIRQRKARRALAATAAAAAGGVLPVDLLMRKDQKCKAPREKQHEGECSVQYKKRCRHTGGPRPGKKIQFKDFIINLSKNSAFHSVFPQDERDAAILLMALSCGLACS